MKLKDTLTLPRTEFPMKAALPQREPERLARWDAVDLAGQLRRGRAGRQRYVLHDGPPYANGHVHLGTALNKILKDFVLKSRIQMGFDVPYVPGWDCHGMPIEHQVARAARQAGEELSVVETRRRCRRYAQEFLGVQREEFRRLGILGDWADPYTTMDPAYEGEIVAAFGRMFARGHVTKGLRSIHWCPTCRTALANAEVEHDPDHVSPAITVRFPVPPHEKAAALGLPADAALLVWTTTPWTLPANVATAVHPDLEYVLVGGPARHGIVARALLARVAEDLGWSEAPVEASWAGRDLVGLEPRHPLADRASPVVPAEYVTTDAGTGVVHTAPGHGAEDFETGVRHGLPILVPVDRSGVFTAEAGKYAGRHVFDSDEEIVKDLAAAGTLVKSSRHRHSYPTCWRCREPLIFLATDQWFLRLDHQGLREACLREVDATRWHPAWGRDRMHDAVLTRPDWCLSRQRAWGVPIPAFACRACGEAVISEALIARVEKLVRERGSDAWFEVPARAIVPEGTACPRCGGTELENDPNILDVWFDASCSHEAVLASGRWPDLSWPADLYLEGVDQHRGWFQVSLLSAVATRGKAPYRAVLTHGLALDEQGKKMSKSLGNVVGPEEVLSRHGADVLRLFFASVDATADFRFSLGLVEPVADGYKKIRNTLRFLLGNLAGFDPDRDAVAEAELLEVDRHALDRLRDVSGQARQAYEEFQFNRVHRVLLAYLTSDVSAFYAHVLKDRLYTELPHGLPRRSAQTVLLEIARECCQLLAPITCFTADEAWEQLPAWRGKEASVHLAAWRPLGAPDRGIAAAWETVHAVRDDVLKALEVARASGLIGDPLEACVRMSLGADADAIARPRREALREVLVVSRLELEAPGAAAPPGALPSERASGAWVHVSRAPGRKCPRCWIYREDGGRLPQHPDTCGRCAGVLLALGVQLDPP
jgi:isoleucyl-tRNA synthetase